MKNLFILLSLSLSIAHAQEKPSVKLKFNQKLSGISQAFFIEDNRLITASYNGLKLWDIETGKELMNISDSTKFHDYKVSESGAYFIDKYWKDGSLELYSRDDQILLDSFKGAPWSSDLRFSSDDRYIYYFDGKEHIIYSLIERKTIFSIAHSEDLTHVDVGWYNNHFFIGSKSKGLISYDLSTGKKSFPVKKENDEIAFWQFKIIDEILILKDARHYRILNLEKGDQLFDFTNSNMDTETAFTFAPKKNLLFIGNINGSVKVIETITKEESILINREDDSNPKISFIGLSKNEDYLVVCNSEKCEIYDLASYQLLQSIQGSDITISNLRFLSNYELFSVLSDGNLSYAYNLNLKAGTNTLITSLKLFSRNELISVRGNDFLETYNDDSTKIYNIKNQNLIISYAHNRTPHSYIYSEDFKYLFEIPHAYPYNDDTRSKLSNLITGEIKYFNQKKIIDFSPVLINNKESVIIRSTEINGKENYFELSLKNGAIKKVKNKNPTFLGSNRINAELQNHNELVISKEHEDSLILKLNIDSLDIRSFLGDEAIKPKEKITQIDNIRKINENYVKISLGWSGIISQELLIAISDSSQKFQTQWAYSPWKDFQISPNSDFIVARSSEGRLGFWKLNPDSIKFLFDFYYLTAADWIAIDNNSLFDASPAAMSNAYFVLDDKEIVEIEQLKDRYFEPKIIQKKLGLEIEPIRDIRSIDDMELYPKINLIQPSKNDGKLGIKLINQGGGIGRILIWINGKEITTDARGKGVDPDASEALVSYDIINHPFLRKGELNKIVVKSYNKGGYLISRDKVLYYLDRNENTNYQPSLHAIIIGVSNYNGDKLDLNYAAKDAEDYAKALELTANQYFLKDNVDIKVLTTKGNNLATWPSKNNIKRAFEEASSITSPDDVLLVYLAGHGVNYGGSDGDFYFLTSEASNSKLTDPAIREQVAISSNELTELIKIIPALKQVLIIDACHSGQVGKDLMESRTGRPSSEIRALERMKDRVGMYVLAGSAADAVSYETSVYGQGLLTYSLLFGMKGAALRDNKFVDIMQLFQFAADKVPELAENIGGIQKPEIRVPYGAQSFDIGIATEQIKNEIVLPSPKPLFLRSNFTNQVTFNDDLRLSATIDNELIDIQNRGENNVIFINASQFSDAYSLKGRYEKSTNGFHVQVRLFKGDSLLSSYEINVENVNEITALIIKKALELIEVY